MTATDSEQVSAETPAEDVVECHCWPNSGGTSFAIFDGGRYVFHSVLYQRSDVPEACRNIIHTRDADRVFTLTVTDFESNPMTVTKSRAPSGVRRVVKRFDVVRGVEDILGMASTEVKPTPKKTGKAKAAAKATPAATTSQVIPLKLVVVKDQVRKTFDPEKQASMTDSLKRNGQLQAIVVRATKDRKFELVIGEYRVRGMRELKWSECRAEVLPVGTTDQQCLTMQIEENLKRTDLNALEVCQAAKDLMDGGLQRAEAAAVIGCSPSEVSNKLRILELPDCLLDKVRAGKVAVTAVRELHAVKDIDWLCEAIAGKLNGDTAEEVRGMPRRCLRGHHPFNGVKLPTERFRVYDQWNTPFPMTKKRREDLQLRTIGSSHFSISFTTDVAAFDKLVEAAEAKQQKSSPGKKGSPSGGKTEQQKGVDQAKALRTKCWRYRVSWCQRHVLEKLDSLSEVDVWKLVLWISQERGGERDNEAAIAEALGKRKGSLSIASLLDAKPAVVRKAAAGLVKAYFSREWNDYRSVMNAHVLPTELLPVEKHLKIDFVKQWRVDEPFLLTHTTQQLAKLVGSEWKIFKPGPTAKRKDIIADVLVQDAAKRLPCPECLKKARKQ